MPTDVQRLLQETGFSFDYGTLFTGIGFSLVGWAAWRYGRRNQRSRQMLLGIALMVYPYFVPNLWWSLGVGSLLTVFLFWP